MQIRAMFLLAVAPVIIFGETEGRIKAANSTLRTASIDPLLDFVLPEVIVGSGWTTSMVFTNLDSRTADFMVYFASADGQPLELPILQLENRASTAVTIQLAPFETVTVDLSEALGFRNGWAWFSSRNANQPVLLGGYVAIKHTTSEGETEATFPFGRVTENRLVVPFNAKGGNDMALSIIHPDIPDAPEAIVTLKFRDESGSEVESISGKIRALDKVSLLLTEAVPSIRDRSGSIVISSTGRQLTALAFRLSPSGTISSVLPTAMPNLASSSPSRPSGQPSSTPVASITCATLEGMSIFADDGKFLGKISASKFTSDSIANEYGPYGSSYSPTSIFNVNGVYGSQFSVLSPFNTVATRPPVLFNGQTPFAFLTVNTARNPRVDANFVRRCVGR
jgi:hypothetical protein